MDALKIEKASHRRFRLGCADGQHHRGAVAGALQGDGFRERLPDRQPGGEQDAVAASRRVRVVVPVLLRHGTRARQATSKYRRDFNKLIWQQASPKWTFDDATYDRSAAAFDNPDHVAIVIHNYRWRLGLAAGRGRSMTIWTGGLPQASGHHRAHHYAWKVMPMARRIRPQRLCEEILGQVRAPDYHGRHRAQSASGSAAGLCPSGRRRRRRLIGVRGRCRHIGRVEAIQKAFIMKANQLLLAASTRQRNRGSDRDLSRGKKHGAANDSRKGSITHRR